MIPYKIVCAGSLLGVKINSIYKANPAILEKYKSNQKKLLKTQKIIKNEK